MKSIIMIICFMISFCFQIFPQIQELSGQITDIETKKPIPYSTVEVKNKGLGAASGLDGIFRLKLSYDIDGADTLLIKSLGYFDSLLTLDEYQRNPKKNIKLRPKTFLLEALVVKPTPDILKKGVFEKPTSLYSFGLGNQIAVFMNNNEKVNGIIRSASFCIGQSPYPKTPFRVRIYGVNESGAPGEDLISEGIIIKGKKKKKWVKVDLSDYQIPVPQEGYFVAMEWIFTDKKFYYQLKIPPPNQKGKIYGQALAMTLKINKPLTWVYTLGNQWFFDDHKLRKSGEYANALINSTIQVYK